MGFLLWITAGLLIAGTLVYRSARRTRQLLPGVEPPGGERLPATLLQRYASRTLLVVVLLTLLAASMVIYHGPQVWWNSDPVRLTVTLVLLAALFAYLVFTLRIRKLEARGDGSIDERDLAIMRGSYAGVGGAMMTVVVVWMIALTEGYSDTGLVPTYYLYLVFWSCVMTNVIASIAGILLAYRRD